MSYWPFTFGHPWFLCLLITIPFIWMWGYVKLSGLGASRRTIILGLRSIVLALLILAIADLHLQWKNDRLTVLFLLDQSASIPSSTQELMVQYVREEVQKNRRGAKGDRAGVIVFGRTAQMEIPPLDDRLPLTQGFEGIVDLKDDATNLESALQLAQATFPEDAAKRVVIVTDGNENLGNATDAARRIALDGVSLDVIAVSRPAGSDVLIEHVLVPTELRLNTSFEARVVLNHIQSANSVNDGKTVRGKLRIRRRRGGQEEIINEQDLEVPPGKMVLSFRDELNSPDFYEYDASFVAENPADDPVRQNNSATAFTQIRGSSQVLILEDVENRSMAGDGESSFLVNRLNAMNIATTVRFSDELFGSLAELQPYDCVILANIPRSSGSGDGDLSHFSDAQIEMLVQNTQQMGCGLIMLGGKNSFGAGGWANTRLEAAMPVDFQIKNSKVQAIGALAMVMHASEMANGNYWQKVIAREAVKVLGPFDYCGVIHWGFAGEEWLWNNKGQGLIRVGQNKPQMLARLDRMTPGDMPEFESSLRLAVAGFSAITDAAVKHMIIISDGDPTPPQFQGGALSQLKRLGVQVTTVAVGTHGDPVTTPLKNIAILTGGKYYVVKSANALPRIFQREARRVSKPLTIEQIVQPKVFSGHEIVNNVDTPPPISGFVMTTIKKNPLVEVLMQSPYPADSENATILATWTYGVGRVVALTTDSGARWSSRWTSWSEYDKFFGQLVRWAMRPNQDNGQYAVSTELENGKVKIVVDVLEAPEKVLGDFSGSILDPQLSSQPLDIHRIAPTRYQAEFPTNTAGSYFITLRPNAQSTPLRIGVNVPYSEEYRYQPSNDPLLRLLASPSDGKTIGYLHPMPLEVESIPTIVQHDAFRRDLAASMSSRQIWPWMLVLASYVFLADIVMRRLAPDVDALQTTLRRIWNSWRKPAPNQGETLDTLRRTKAEIQEKLERQKSTVHFDPTDDEKSFVSKDNNTGIDNVHPDPTPSNPVDSIASTSITPEPQDGFLSRLLRAKKSVQKDRPPQDPGASSS